MYQSFSIMESITDLKNKKIIIRTNQEINNKDYSDLQIQLFERKTRTPILFDIDIEDKDLILTLKQWPIPNSEYILGIKGLKNVLDEDLDIGNLKTKLFFKSAITSKVKILSPVKFEKIEELVIKLEEINEKQDEIKNSFYIEISKDNAFINTPYCFFVPNKNIIPINILKFGQYFMRVRVQTEKDEDIEYGEWSDITTFLYGNEKEEGNIPPSLEVEEDCSPVIEEDFELVSSPVQGEIENSFIFEFNMPLEEFFSGKDIVIIRKDVK